MNGATAEVWVKNIKAPNKNIMIMIGASHHLFLTLKKSQNSFTMPSFPMCLPPC